LRGDFSLPLVDRFGREVSQLRISLTEKCNLNCFFCHREGCDKSEGELSPPEVRRLVEAAASLGVKKVKLTGGEPLLRSDLEEIIWEIARIPGITEVSLTTNGFQLAERARALRRAGLKRVNVNLPSLRIETYHAITGSLGLGEVIEGVLEAERQGLTPVKLNMVVLKGLNVEEVEEAMSFIEGKDIILQLIELERIGVGRKIYDQYFYDLGEIERRLASQADRVEVKPLHNRKVYHLKGGSIRVELVRPFHNSEFCANCKRLRVTSDGKLKPCLMRNDNLVDVASLLRSDASLEALKEAFRKAVELREPYYPYCVCRVDGG